MGKMYNLIEDFEVDLKNQENGISKEETFFSGINLKKAQVAYELALDKKDSSSAYKYLSDIGEMYFSKGDYVNSHKYYEKAYNLTIKESLVLEKAKSLNNLGLVFNKMGNYEKSLDYYRKSLRIIRKTDNYQGISEALTNMADVYDKLNKTDLAFSSYQNSLKINTKYGDENGRAYSLSKLGNIYLKKMDFDNALSCYLDSYNSYQKLENLKGVAFVANNIGIIYNKQGKFEEALKFLKMSNVVNKKLGLKWGIATTLASIAGILLRTQKRDEAYIVLQEAKALAKELNAGHILKNIYGYFADYYEAEKDYEKALKYYKKYSKLRNSIFWEDNKKRFTGYQLGYEREKKKKEFQIYKLKNVDLAKTKERLSVVQHQLIESEKMASLGSLVAGVAHEINTPVGICITAISELYNSTVDFAKKYRQHNFSSKDFEAYLALIHKANKLVMSNLQRTGELIQGFKQVSVDQSSEIKRRFNFKDYLEDVIRSLRPKFKEYSKEVDIVINCSEKIKIKSYPGIFAQLFTNLIINTVIHGFENVKKGVITIRVFEDEGNLQIVYMDDGKGIKKENRKKIFDPFFTTNNKRGTGLGMHIVYNLVVQKLEGSIGLVDNDNQKGVRFVISIPLKR